MATLADIGLQAGYSRGLPAARYGGKLGLVTALLDAMERWCETSFGAATADLQGLASLEARASAHIAGGISIPDGAAALQTIVVEARTAFPELQPRVAALLERWRLDFRDDLVEAKRLGQVRSDLDCEAYAGLTLAIIRGTTLGRCGEELRAIQRWLPSALRGIVQQSGRSGFR